MRGGAGGGGAPKATELITDLSDELVSARVVGCRQAGRAGRVLGGFAVLVECWTIAGERDWPLLTRPCPERLQLQRIADMPLPGEVQRIAETFYIASYEESVSTHSALRD